METSDLSDRVARIEGQMATKDGLQGFRDELQRADNALKDEVVGVKEGLQGLDARVENGFNELKAMMVVNTKNEEIRWLKTMLRWVIPGSILVAGALITLAQNLFG